MLSILQMCRLSCFANTPAGRIGRKSPRKPRGYEKDPFLHAVRELLSQETFDRLTLVSILSGFRSLCELICPETTVLGKETRFDVSYLIPLSNPACKEDQEAFALFLAKISSGELEKILKAVS